MNEPDRYQFKITCKSKMYGTRTCEMRLETGELLTYMPVPDEVKFCFNSIKRFYEGEEGQKIIRSRVHNKSTDVAYTRIRGNDGDGDTWMSGIDFARKGRFINAGHERMR